MKKIFAIMLALVLVLAMGASAMAATITISSSVGSAGTVGNETFTAYKIFDASMSGTNVSYTVVKDSHWHTALKGYSGLSFTEISGQNKYTVSKTDSFDIDALAALIAANLDGVTGQTLTGYGTHTLTDGDGYYYILSSLGSSVIIDTFSTAEISEKNDYPSVEKKIVVGTEKLDATTADRGQTITFEITVTIPKTANKEIVVHDTLDSAMTYNEGQELASGVTKRGATCTPQCSFEFVISATKVSDIVALIPDNETSGTFVFTYTVTLNANATTATEHKNKVYITYSTFKSVEDEVTVTTYELDVYKYTLVDGAEIGLAGASFALKNADGKYYYKNDNGVVTWVDRVENATVLTTAAPNYTVNFAGIANGTYTLVEIQAPIGYNPASDTPVTISGANLTNTAQIKVLNSTGTELPSTGGIGTTIFYVVGGLLMAAAVVLLVTKKKVSSK